MQRKMVVLPLPLAPMSDTTSPVATSSDKSRSTVLVPNDLVTPRRLTFGAPVARDAARVVTLPPEFHWCDGARGATGSPSSE